MCEVRLLVVAIVIRLIAVLPDGNQALRGVQAEATDGAIVPEAVLRLLRVIAGKDDGDVVIVKFGGAGCIHTAFEEAHGIADYRFAGGNGD